MIESFTGETPDLKFTVFRGPIMFEFFYEVIFRALLESIFYGLSYGTGYLLLKAISFGKLRLAPLTTITEKNRRKRKWYQIDWDIWLHLALQGRVLKAECVCLVGMLSWAVAGLLIYFQAR